MFIFTMADSRQTAASLKRKGFAKNRNNASLSCSTSLCLSIIIGALLRFAIALHSHSGEGQAPMFGDYEAQRHWMEVTVNLPITEWYRNSTQNDLLYWGLDYPPLTAYHSYIMGSVGAAINSSYVAPFTSRGLETSDLKIFMRYTVFLADFLLFFPAVILYFYLLCKTTLSNQSNYIDWITLSLIYPGFILIDHGHFQYNCVSLGFTIVSVACLLMNRICKSAVFFTLALNYKQMSLYHALPFFIFMLRTCMDQNNLLLRLTMLSKLGLTVIVSFVLLWFPFIVNGRSVLDVLHRIFPVARGIFEDKVANVWCVINIVYKLKGLCPQLLLRICTAATLTASLPSLFCLFRNPSHRQLLLSLINVSLAFFLFSFQVHEKSILLVVLPVILYAPYDPFPCSWFLAVSSYSLLHLAFKDNLIIPFIALNAFFGVYLVYSERFFDWKIKWTYWLFITSIVAAFLIFLCSVLVDPPPRFPDIWALLIAVFSATHFVMFYLYFNIAQFFGHTLGCREYF